MEAQKKAEQDAEAVSLKPPDTYPAHDLRWLEGADLYESLTESVVVNPRNLQPRTLEDIDYDWLRSRALWHRWLKFFRDEPERAKAGMT